MAKPALTAQQIADAYTEHDDAAAGKPDRDAKIIELAKEGLTQTAIAERVHLSQPQVSRILERYSPTITLAKLRANSAALRLVDRVIDQADVDQSLEVLDRIGVLERRQQERNTGPSVNIVIGMPTQPAGPDPVIDFRPALSLPTVSEQDTVKR